MKTIAFITTNDWVSWGGSEVLWSRTAALMAGEQKTQVLVSIKEWTETPEHIKKLEAVGAKIFFRKKANRLPFQQRLMNRFLPGRFQFHLESNPYSILDDRPYLAVLSLGDHNEGFNWSAECRKRNIPYVLIVQLVKEGQLYADGYAADLIRESYIKSLRNYFVSKNNLELVEKQIPGKLPNSEVIFNPFQVDFQVDLPYASDKNIVSVACVASLNSGHKGQEILFEVFNMPKWRERNIELNLYGGGPHKKYFSDLKAYLKLDKVNFKGYSGNIQEAWKENQALIMASRMEGLPLALVEAMVCNRTAIVTDIGGNRELIEDNVNGFIAKAPTVELMDEALERAWKRRDEWEALGKKAGEKVRSVVPSDPVKYFADRLYSLLG